MVYTEVDGHFLTSDHESWTVFGARHAKCSEDVIRWSGSMASLTVNDVLQSRILMLASYSTTSSQLEASLSGSGWDTVPLGGDSLFRANPFLIAPVTSFAARSGSVAKA